MSFEKVNHLLLSVIVVLAAGIVVTIGWQSVRQRCDVLAEDAERWKGEAAWYGKELADAHYEHMTYLRERFRDLVNCDQEKQTIRQMCCPPEGTPKVEDAT